MRNTILSLEGKPYKSTALSDQALLVSTGRQKSMEAFLEATNSSGLLSTHKAISFDKVKRVKHNSASGSLRYVYINDKGKEKSADLDFGDATIASAFGQELAAAANLSATSAMENQAQKFLSNGAILLAVIGFTAFIALSDPSDIQNSRARKAGILKLIVGTVGTTGVWIIGGLIAAYLAYDLYNRYQNPATVTVWE